MKFSMRSLVCGALVLALPTGCGVEIIGDTTGGEDTIPDSVQRAFDRSCATAGCHDEGSRQGGLSLASASSSAIFDIDAKDAPTPGHKMLVLGSLKDSYLALKMLHPDLPAGTKIAGTVMPPASTSESRADVDLILKWIETGEDPSGGGASSSSSTSGSSDSTAGSSSSTGDGSDCFGPEPGSVPAGQLTLATHIQPIFTGSCASVGCHAPGPFPPQLDAAGAATSLKNIDSKSADMVFVKPGAPEQSYLWRKVSDTHGSVPNGGGTVMPPNGSGFELCDSDRELIRDWIMAGAN